MSTSSLDYQQAARLRSDVVAQRGLHARIRAARLRKNMPQLRVAQECGVSRVLVAQWENPNDHLRSTPSVVQMKTIARICDVPISMLMDDRVTADQILALRDPGVYAQARREEAVDELQTLPRRLPGVASPQGHLFWSQVQSTVCTAKPALLDCFNVPIEAAGVRLVAPFLRGKYVVRFGELPDPIARSDFLASEVPALLMLERALGHACKLHLLVYCPLQGPGQRPVNGQVTKVEEFGVTLHLYQSVDAAAHQLVTF